MREKKSLVVDKNFCKFKANGHIFEIIENVHSEGKKSKQFLPSE